MAHVFISYVSEDQASARRLCDALMARGIDAWLDKDRIPPGSRWRQEIKKAIADGVLFLACFSDAYSARPKNYMNEELTLAVDQLRLMPTDRTWFIPVKFSNCVIPERDIGGGATLRDLQWVDFSSDWNEGFQRLCLTIALTDRKEREPQTSVRRHSRELSLNRDEGPSTVAVKLEELTLLQPFFLASLPPNASWSVHTLRGTKADGSAAAELHVIESRGELWLTGDGRYCEVEVHCELANTHAVDGAEARYMPAREAVDLEADEDAFLYAPSCPTQSLRLSVVAEDGLLLEQHGFRQQQGKNALRWDMNEVASTSSRVGTQKVIEMIVSEPDLRSRYGLRYHLKSGRLQLPPNSLHCVDLILSRCRSYAKSEEALAQRFTQSVLASLKATWEDFVPDDVHVVGRLWSERAGRLYPAFGVFPPEVWAKSLSYGSGVPGNAFRFLKCTYWHTVTTGDGEPWASLVYRSGQHDEPVPPDWILELPLLHDHDRGIGTLGISGAWNLQSGGLRRCLVGLEHGQTRTEVSALVKRLSLAFWKTAAEVDLRAAEVYERWWAGGSAPGAA
jgi:hypothetical protein